MKIDRLRVQDIDEFGGRVVDVRTGTTQFKTPTRAATSTEYNYKKDLGLVDPFDNEVGEYVARFHRADLEVFTSSNSSYDNRRRTAASYANQMSFVVSKCYPQIPHNLSLDERDLRLLVEVQVEAGLDMVSIPYDLARTRALIEHYKRWAGWAEEYAETLGRSVTPIPYVPMRLERALFEDTMRELWNRRAEFPVVGLTYFSWRQNKLNFDFLRANRDEETWHHMSQVPRAEYRGKTADLSLMHIPQIYGVDTVATAIPWGGGNLDDPASYRTFRYFDPDSLSVPKIEDWIEAHGGEDTGCPCAICRERAFPEIVDQFAIRAGERSDLKPLFGVFRLHEVFRSSDAFGEGRVYISENEFRQYLADRIGPTANEFSLGPL